MSQASGVRTQSPMRKTTFASLNCLSKNSNCDSLELGSCHEALDSSHDPIDQ